jgi:hypothetical protein
MRHCTCGAVWDPTVQAHRYCPENVVIPAAGNWRRLKQGGPGEGGLYLVRLEIDGVCLYNVARWDGVHWDLFERQITHWAPLYSPTGDCV